MWYKFKWEDAWASKDDVPLLQKSNTDKRKRSDEEDAAALPSSSAASSSAAGNQQPTISMFFENPPPPPIWFDSGVDILGQAETSPPATAAAKVRKSLSLQVKCLRILLRLMQDVKRPKSKRTVSSSLSKKRIVSDWRRNDALLRPSNVGSQDRERQLSPCRKL